MGRIFGNEKERIDHRLLLIEKHIEHYEYNLDKKLTDKKILTLLKLAGHHISKRQLQYDKSELARNNTFVSDIAKKSYSKFMEDRVKTMQKCSKVLEKIMDSEDIVITTITEKTTPGKMKKDKDGKMIKEDDILETIKSIQTSPAHKIQAANSLHNCEDTLAKLISGDILRTSAASWSRYTKELEAKVYQLKEKLKQNEIIIQ